MRLTGKYDDGYYNGYYTTGQMSSGIAYYDEKKFTNAAIDKLGKLEDVEEDLGINLIVREKALQDGVWYKSRAHNKVFCPHVKLVGKGKYLELRRVDYNSGPLIAPVNEYGKRWALTREELE